MCFQRGLELLEKRIEENFIIGNEAISMHHGGTVACLISPPPTSTWTHSVIQLHLEMFVRKFYQLIIRLLVVSVPVLLCLYLYIVRPGVQPTVGLSNRQAFIPPLVGGQ